MRRRAGRWVLGCCIAAAIGPPSAQAQSAPDAGRAFEPRPASLPLYDVQPPEADPARQRHTVTASDGIELFLEAWLPKARAGGPAPPAEVPTVVVLSPYHSIGAKPYEAAAQPGLTDQLVSRGYAVVAAHGRGTGQSGGCFENISPRDADDGARIFEFLGSRAPWSDGTVAALGLSQDGGRPTAAATLDRAYPHLRALVVLAPVVSRYATSAFDGVPYSLDAANTEVSQFMGAQQRRPPSAHTPGTINCVAQQLPEALDHSGDMTAYLWAREWRRHSERIKAPVLYVHGHRDTDVEPISARGFFDALTVPRAGIFGVFEHEFPSQLRFGVHEEWERADFPAMVLAWVDRYLKGERTGVEQWPVAQVQSADGQWRAEREWPAVSGKPGQLALGPGGTLGAAKPSGASSYVEDVGFAAPGHAPGSALRFSTAALPGRLEVPGQPVLDIWIEVDRPDAHLAARLTALDADGKPVPHTAVLGFRSLRHLEPLVDGRFEQRVGAPAPVDTPIRVALRFQPGNLVVPQGGRLSLEIAGTQIKGPGFEGLAPGAPVVIGQPSWPSLSFSTVTVLHDCEHPSALRFTVPGRRGRLLNVRERDEGEEPLVNDPKARPPDSSGGGLARAPVCGEAPSRTSRGGRAR